MTYVVPILAGTLGLLSGFVALYAAKGARLHRKAGMAFVYVMLTTTMFGLVITTVRGVAPAINIHAALLTGATRCAMSLRLSGIWKPDTLEGRS